MLAAAEQINRRRAVMEKVALLMETSDRELLERVVEALYHRAAESNTATRGRTSRDRVD